MLRRHAELVVYGLTAGIFWFIPLLNRLHVESMAALAFIAFFTAGHAAHCQFKAEGRDAHVNQVLFQRYIRLLLPASMLTLAMVWAPNCDYFRGLAFFALFPGITVLLAVSGSYFLTVHKLKFRWFVLAGVLVGMGGPLYDLGLHPQFYTYNHLFGGVLGPIYDEILTVRTGLYWFRGLTVLWAALLYLAARRKFGMERSMGRIGIVVLSIGFAYLFSAYLGFNTPAWYLRQQLSGLRQTAHFSIHYDRKTTDDQQVERWAVEHEFRYAQLRDALNEDVDEEIHSYVYPDDSTRAVLIGARRTSVSPVWLHQPQLHVLENQMGSVFPHELAHVFSRGFGIPLINASISVGLVEGLAVATEPPDGRPTPDEMVAASELFRETDPDVLVEQVSATLTASGFWSGRGAVSYTFSGSFVSFLLRRYGVERFKLVYPYGDFISIYGKSAEKLGMEWIGFVESLPIIDCSASMRAALAFSIPSLFEQSCPHWEPPASRRTRAAEQLLVAGMAEQARDQFAEIVTKYDGFQPARVGWARASLAIGRGTDVIDSMKVVDRSSWMPEEAGALADAFALTGQADSARVLYESIRVRYPRYARDARAFWAMRKLTVTYPDILSVLNSADSIENRRADLASVLVEREIETGNITGPGILWSAMLASEGEAWSDALAFMERVLAIPHGPCSSGAALDIKLACPVWAASFAYRAGDIERAQAYAETASAVALDAGDLSLIRVLDDFRMKLDWIDRNRSLLHR